MSVADEKLERQPELGPESNTSNASTQPVYDDPFKWSTRRKWTITVVMAALTFSSTFCSSIWSSTITVTAKEFHTSETVMLLGVSLFVLGYGTGPLFWGPLSELTGRKIPLMTGHFLFTIMQIPIALGRNVAGLLICRHLAGCFGAAAVVVTSAACSDFWDPANRGLAMGLFSIAAYAGPALGPVVGAYVTDSHLGWRWTAWLVLIFAGAIGVLAVVIIPETYVPVLKQRAMGRWAVPFDGQKSIFSEFLYKYLSRPMLMLLQEPLLDVMTLYISLTYGIMYLTFFAFPYAFAERGWSRSNASLSFLSLMVGVLIAVVGVVSYSKWYYAPRFRARGKICPEDRLPPVMLGGILLPAGLFWFGWTSNPAISWVPQILSGVFIGCGIMLVFTNGLVYIIDVYLQSAASAVAANTFARSIVAAGLPLAAPSAYSHLGTPWATSMLAFMCVALIPAPFLFHRYGEALRKNSKFVTQR